MTTRPPANPFLQHMEPAPRADGFAGLTDAERDHAQAGVAAYQDDAGITPPSPATPLHERSTHRHHVGPAAANDDPEVNL